MILVQPLFLCPESQGSCACRERSREGVLHRSPRLRLPLPRLREEELSYALGPEPRVDPVHLHRWDPDEVLPLRLARPPQ